MGKFKSIVDTHKRLVEFRRKIMKYNFPDDVEVSYCLESEEILFRREGRVVILLVAIVEGGVRIPISDLLTNFLWHFKVYPDQCTPNIFRIVSNVDTLNKRLGLNLTEHDIKYIYSFQDSKISGFYFKVWHGEVRLISSLPDSDKEIERDYLIILGNEDLNGIHCPMSAGKAGG